MKIHCSSDISCPKDLKFLYSDNYIRRAGIIPFMIYNGITYVLLGLSNEKNPVFADLGGRREYGENTLQTALREFGEESRYVLPIDLNRITKILITNKNEHATDDTKPDDTKPDQVILVVQIDPTPYNIYIDTIFQNTIPKTKYENEMKMLKWIPYDIFIDMVGMSKSIKNIQKLLNMIK